MIKTFEELRSHIWEVRHCELECIVDRLDGSTEFNRGQWSGVILAYDEILDLLRTSLKYGEPEELE